jgi:hypothetical protein
VPVLSSILEALKKVERESAMGNGKDVPWPVLPVNSTIKDNRRRHLWWISLGGIAISFVIAFAFWLAQRPTTTDQQPVVTKRAIEPQTLANNQSAPSPARHAVPAVPVSTPPTRLPQKEPVPAQTPDVSTVKPLPKDEPKAKVKEAAEAKPPIIAPPQDEPKPNITAEARPPSTTPPPAASTQRPAEMANAPRQPESSRENNAKEYHSDERIDLQALVWAPQAADRFVVINNILLKEGGSIDKITVVRINEDDVLLSEGSDRWYQEFKIR